MGAISLFSQMSGQDGETELAKQSLTGEYECGNHITDKLQISSAVSYSLPRSALASNFCVCFLHKRVDGFMVILKQ
jgi:hypothetical protein